MAAEASMDFGPEGSKAFAALAELVAPAARAVVDRLPRLAPGAAVVDLACGPGEPGLSVRRRFPGLRLTGVDRSPAMLALARAEAGPDPDVRFVESDLESLDLPAASADAIVSRFGFLSFEDLTRSVPEFLRVARPGCAFSVVVWDRLKLNTTAWALHESARGMVDDDLLPPLDELDRRAAERRQIAALREADVSALHTQLVTWSSRAESVDSLWGLVAGGGIFAAAIGTLDGDGVAELRRRFADLLAPYADASGGYLVPTTCRVLWGAV